MAFLASPANHTPYRRSDMSTICEGDDTSSSNVFDLTSSTSAAAAIDTNLFRYPVPHGYPPQHANPIPHAPLPQNVYPQHAYPYGQHWHIPIYPTSDRATPIRQPTKGNHLAAQNKKRKYNSNNDGGHYSMEEINTPIIKPVSASQDTKTDSNRLDEPMGLEEFPYKNFTIGIPDDLSTHSTTLVAHQQSSIDAGAVYGVTILTQVSFCGIFGGRSLVLFNSPPTKRELIDPALFVLSLVEANHLVIAGIALVGYPTYHNIAVTTQAFKLPKDTILWEIARDFATHAPRSLKSSSTEQVSSRANRVFGVASENEDNRGISHSSGQCAGPTAPQGFTQDLVPLRSFPTEVNWGRMAVVVCPKFPLSSNIQLPTESMTIWTLIEWLTGRIDGYNGQSVAEEEALLQNISAWAARIHSHLDTDNIKRRVFLISLIGKRVKLKSGAWKKLGGMRGGDFVVRDEGGKGNNEVIQMDEILG